MFFLKIIINYEKVIFIFYKLWAMCSNCIYQGGIVPEVY